VQGLLVVLTDKITASTAKLSGQGIGSAIYGLKNMHSGDVVMSSLLEALANKVNAKIKYKIPT
jgi:hypothetical protein